MSADDGRERPQLPPRRRSPRMDEPLKVVLREHAAELADLVGEPGASVLSARSLELNTLMRRLDCVLELRRGGQVHYRIVEFEARLRRGGLGRFLLYTAQLMEEVKRPVLTTIVALGPPAPPAPTLVFRVQVEGRTRNRWRFDLVRLWERVAGEALERGTPGYLALVPLMRGGRDLQVIARASERLAETDPPHGLSEAHTALFALAGRYYTVSELARIVGRDKLMQSSLWTEALAEGRQQGLQQGRLAAERELCRAVVARHHPQLLSRATAVIDACQDPQLLERWILEAPVSTPAAFAQLLGIPEP